MYPCIYMCVCVCVCVCLCVRMFVFIGWFRSYGISTSVAYSMPNNLRAYFVDNVA